MQLKCRIIQMMYKIKVFVYYSFLSSFLLINPSSLFSQENLNVENLLNRLQIAETNDAAKKIRAQIWNKWVYAIPKDAQQNLKYALNEFNSGRLLSAEKAFTDLIKKYPNYTEGWNKRATIRYMLNDLEGSLKDIDKVLKLQPRHFGAIAGSGLIYIKKKKYEKALNFYKSLDKIDPMNEESKMFIKLINKMLLENSA